MIPILAGILFLLALVLLWQSSRQKKTTGLPGGRVIYVDTHGWGSSEKLLFDPELNLTGKPDYLVQQGKKTIPVEVKSTRGGGIPYDSHIFQLAVYCLLVSKCMGKRPPYGILHYPGSTYAIDYTPALESALMDILGEIRVCEKKATANRSHDQPARCSRCGYRSACDQRLA